MSEPRDHHVVPRFYLAAWTNDKGYLRASDKLRGRSRLRTTSQIAYEENLYLWNDKNLPDGSDPLQVEKKFLNAVERLAAPVIKRLRTVEPPELRQEDIPPLADFIAIQGLRSPRAIEYLKRWVREQAAGSTITTPRGDNVPAEEWLKTAGGGEFIALNQDAIRTDAQNYRRLWWSVIETPPILLTSDAPVILEEGGGDYLSIALPLSPRSMLIGRKSDQSAWAYRTPASLEQVAMWNQEIARAATRWVVDQPGRTTGEQLVRRLG